MFEQAKTSLRAVTLRAIVATMVGLLILLMLTSELLITRSFLDLEERSMRQEVEQTRSAIENEIANLDRTTLDYASWDDSYAFVVDGNAEYIAANLVDETFINNRLTFLAFINTAGETVFARRFDPVDQRALPVPQELQSFDGSNAILLQHHAVDSATSGILMIDGKPVLIAARPVLTSAYAGPPNGTLIMGRDLDDAEIAKIMAITGDNLTITSAIGPMPSVDFDIARKLLTAETPSVVRPLSADQVAAYAAIPDLRGGDGILLQIDMPRDIYQYGQAATRYYLVVLLLATLGFTVAVFLILERNVLARIISLGAQVARIGDSKDAQKRVVVAHNDEISHLGIAINTMLDDLERAAHRLEQSEARYRQLIEITPETIVVHDGERIRYINPAGARLFGVDDPTILVGHAADAFLPPVNHPSSDGLVPYERSIMSPRGDEITLEMATVPLIYLDAPAWQVVARNITERKQTETALREARDAADAANRSKSRFLANMSHELRTPLTAILGYAELIAREVDGSHNNNISTDISRVLVAGKHLLALINDLLDLSKIEAGRMELHTAHFTVAPMAQEIIQGLQPFAQKRGNTLRLEIDPTIHTMYSDELRVRQILLNLLHNACKFTENGLVLLSVQRGASPEHIQQNGHPTQIIFTVRDTGIGLSADQIAVLFQDFTQADSTTTRKYGGTGLGLALSRRLSRILGGDIAVTSELGAGATFIVTLAETLPDGHAETPALAEPQATLLSAAENHGSLDIKQIALLIEHEPEIRELLPRLLNRTDLHVETAADGLSGIELAKILMPDIIILDTMLPERDGWSILAELKSAPETASIPVILLTVEQDARRGLLLGAAELLTKPVDFDRLQQQVHTLLADRRPMPDTDSQQILIVEDDAHVREYLCRTLKRDGWHIAEAENGLEAIKHCRQQMPDAIVLDLMMPEMDGIQFIELLRATPDGPGVPIIVVTAKELTAAEREQLNRSVSRVLRKGTFHGDELIRTIQSTIVTYARLKPGEGTPV